MTTMLDLLKQRGEAEPQTETEWSAYHAKRIGRRNENYLNARQVLAKNQIPYKELPDKVFVIEPGIVYYPEQGRWYKPGNGQAHYGVRNLVRFLKEGVKS